MTGKRPLHQVLHLALTRYAGYFDRRHRRVGHLFQNRYKSILCERDAYFQELVRYIHLNPVRARLVETPAELAMYPWCGHGVLLDRTGCDWQATREVLALFGPRVNAAREAYQRFVLEGWSQGRRPELVGGGRRRDIARARALVAYWLVEELGRPGTEAARLLHVSQPIVSRQVAKLRAAPPRERLA